MKVVIYESVCCRDMTDGDKMSCSSTPTMPQEMECASSFWSCANTLSHSCFSDTSSVKRGISRRCVFVYPHEFLNGSSLWFLGGILTYLSAWSELSFTPLYCYLKALCNVLPVFCCIPTVCMPCCCCDWSSSLWYFFFFFHLWRTWDSSTLYPDSDMFQPNAAELTPFWLYQWCSLLDGPNWGWQWCCWQKNIVRYTVSL